MKHPKELGERASSENITETKQLAKEKKILSLNENLIRKREPIKFTIEDLDADAEEEEDEGYTEYFNLGDLL